MKNDHPQGHREDVKQAQEAPAKPTVYTVRLSERQAICLEALLHDHRKLLHSVQPHCQSCGQALHAAVEGGIWSTASALVAVEAASACHASVQAGGGAEGSTAGGTAATRCGIVCGVGFLPGMHAVR